jgi:hypothetical protein
MNPSNILEVPSLEEVIARRLQRREPLTLLDDKEYMEQQEAYELLLYNQELNKDKPIPEPPLSAFQKLAGQTASLTNQMLEIPTGVGEAGLQLGTGTAAFLGGGVASLASYLNRLATESRAGTQDIMGRMPVETLRPTRQDLEQFNLITRESTYQPRTATGQEISDILMFVPEAVKFAADWAQEKVRPLGLPPEINALFGSAVEIGALLLGDKVLRSGYRRGVGIANKFFQNLDAGDIPAATTEARKITALIGPSELAQARERLVNVLRRTEEVKTAQASPQALRDIVERIRTEPLRAEVELQLLDQINTMIPPGVNKIEYLQSIGYSPNEANIINSRLSTLGRTSAQESFNLTDAIRRFEDPNSSRAARIEAIEEIRNLTAERPLESFGLAPPVRERIARMLEAPETFEPPQPSVEDIAARDVREGIPIYSPEGQYLPQGAPPVAGNLAQQRAQQALREARAIRRGEEPPEPLPVVPTPPPTTPPVAPIVAPTRTPQQIVNDALDVLLSDESTLTTRGVALRDIKREALKAVPGKLEEGLRALGVEEQYINDFLPAMRNVRVGRIPTTPRDVISTPPVPSDITVDIPPVTPARPPEANLSVHPEYLVQDINNRVQLAELYGITDDIIREALTGTKIASQIAAELRDRVPASITNSELRGIVLGVRTKYGIPNLDEIRAGEAQLPSPVVQPKESPGVSITPEQQAVLDSAFANLADVNIRGAARRDARSDISGIAERLNISVENLPGITSEQIELFKGTTRPTATRTVAPKPVEPVREAALTSFQEYKNSQTTRAGKPVADLVVGQALRTRGIELTEEQFAALSEQLKNVPLNPTSLAEFMETYLQTRSAEIAKTSAKLNDGDIANPKSVSTEDRAQYVETSQRTNLPYTIDQILDNLANGVDITSDLPPRMAQIYARGLAYHNKKLTKADGLKRSEIIQAIRDLFPEFDPGTLGAFYPGSLGPRQKLALQQLTNEAIRQGKNLIDLIRTAVGLNDFQKQLYIEYVRGLDIPPPKPYMELNNMGFDSEASLRGDFVIKRAKGEGNSHFPEVYNSDYETAVMAKEMTPVAARNWYQRGLRPNWIRTNGIRVFENAGLQEWYYAYRGVEQALQLETNSLFKTLKRLSKSFTLEQRQAIMTHALSLEEGGLKLLEAAKIEPRALNPAELAMYETFRGQFESFLERANAVRANTGRLPLNYEENYFTFIRSALDLERRGIRHNTALDDPDVISERFKQSRNVPFPYEKKRTGAAYIPELDAFKVFGEYARRVLEDIHISPFKAKMFEIINTDLRDPVTKSIYRFREDKPVLTDFLNKWLNYIGRGEVPHELPAEMRNLIYTMDKNLGASYIAFNEVTALTQLTSIFQTWLEVGGPNLIVGATRYLTDIVTPGQPLRKARMKESKLLNTRNLDLAIDEFATGIQEGVMRRNRGLRAISEGAEAATKFGVGPTRILDGMMAEISFEAGKQMAKRKGLEYTAAWNVADDVVTRTQGSTLRGDRANIQRTIWGRAITRFQNFAINSWDQITHDIFGVDNPNLSTKDKAIKISRLIFGGAIFSAILEYVFGYSPVTNLIGGAYYQITGEERPKGVVPQALGYRAPRQQRIPEDESIMNFAERIIGSPTVGEALKATPIIGGARIGTSTGMGPLADYTMESVKTLSGGTKTTVPEMLLRGFVPGGSTLHQVFRPERKNTQSLKSLSKPTK